MRLKVSEKKMLSTHTFCIKKNIVYCYKLYILRGGVVHRGNVMHKHRRILFHGQYEPLFVVYEGGGLSYLEN